ncbi:MAG: hypothetical protein ACC651_07415 [Candidatus Scalindua sp.]
MEITPFEKFILENLYNLWKEYGTSEAKTFEALIEEYDFKEKNLRKPLKRLISAGLVDTDSYSAWITKKGITLMESACSSGESTVVREDKAPVSIVMNFLNNFEKAISKSELQPPEREMWLNGIKQISQHPVLLKAMKKALKATTGE